MASTHGFELPGYELLELAGKGGMATVWTARQLSLDRVVAIKVLASSLVSDKDALERFRFEAQAAARLRHPGIVQVFDAGEHNGRAYYVMEYVPGITLAELLERKKRLPEKHALAVAEGVILALQYAWQEARIVHCDIKPGNIMIERDGTVKVADLGLARMVKPGTSGDESDDVLSTPNYTSPEQARGDTELDCRADIYSLGATLYHVMTGHMPFSESPVSQVLLKQISSYLPEPLELNPSLSQEAGWLLEKMMVKDRTLRYRKWSHALEDVQIVAKGGMPSRPFPDDGKSTILRGDQRSLELTPKQKANTQQIVIARAKEAAEEKKEPKKPRQQIVLPREAVSHLKVKPRRRKKKSPVQMLLLNILSLLLLVGVGYGIISIIMKQRSTPEKRRQPSIKEDALPPRAHVVSKEPEQTPPRTHNESPPVTQPAQRRAAAEPSAQQHRTITWKDPVFLEGAHAFNAALKTYQEYQQTKENPAILHEVERKCRAALEAFQQCRKRAPADVDIDDFINRCYHLISDCRQSMLVAPSSALNGNRPRPRSQVEAHRSARPGIPADPSQRKLALSPSWNMGRPQRSKAVDDLKQLLGNEGSPAKDLAPDPHLRLRGDISYLMPADNAAKLLDARLSSRRTLSCPGFPENSFFYYTLNGDFGYGFNQLLLITDTTDRVIGIQLNDDAPGDQLWLNHARYQDNWNIYNFIQKKGKGHSKWKIGHHVHRENGLVIIDSELVTHDPNGYFELGDSKSRSSLRLPQQIVDLILYRIQGST